MHPLYERASGLTETPPRRESMKSRSTRLAITFGIAILSNAAHASQPGSNSVAKSDPAGLMITGNVMDRESKRPIESFRVIPGTHPRPKAWYWQRRQSAVAANGQYRIRDTLAGAVRAVRIEADGYQPAVSRDVKRNEGNVTLNFELTKGENIDGVVLAPAGEPAGKAKIAVGIAGSYVSVRNGEIVFANGDLREADAGGHFHFPPQLPGYFLVITHPSGYAKYQPGPHSNRRTIHLDPWTRVEGRLRVGGKPKADVPIWINRLDHREDFPDVLTIWETTSGPEGRFVFERVWAGKGWIGPRLMLSPDKGAAEAISVRWIWGSYPFGKTVRIDLNGNGRRVVGKLRPPPGLDKPVPWNFTMIQVAPIGAKGAVPNVHFEATVGPDGAFHIDDVPAGEYLIAGGIMLNSFPGGNFERHFFVPAIASGQSAEPLDLGVLTLHDK